jgi:hypothetical protein
VLDAAFHAENSIMALHDPEIISKLKVEAVLALIAW